MEQGREAKVPEKAGARDKVEPTVAEVRAVVLPQVRVGPVFAQSVVNKYLTNWELPAMSSTVPNVEPS